MQDSIFTIELPLINTDEELEKIKAIYPNYDPYFIASGCIKERRIKFENLWLKFKPYADRHFLAQAKINFHQRSWEMYVGNVLLEKKLFIESKNEGPDFVANSNIYIECVACTKGDPSKPDSVPEMYVARTLDEICVQDVPVDKMILRMTQAIKDKAVNQHGEWKNKIWFNKQDPFIIAINTGDLEHPQDYLGIPLIIKALFGLEFLQICRKGDNNFSWRNDIKKGGSEVPVKYFTNKDFNFVSGILFSDKMVLNHPDNIGEDCIFVNNPFAQNPVNNDFANLFHNLFAKDEQGAIKLTKNY